MLRRELLFLLEANPIKTRMVVTPDYQSLLTLNLILWKNHDAKIRRFEIRCKHYPIYLC